MNTNEENIFLDEIPDSKWKGAWVLTNGQETNGDCQQETRYVGQVQSFTSATEGEIMVEVKVVHSYWDGHGTNRSPYFIQKSSCELKVMSEELAEALNLAVATDLPKLLGNQVQEQKPRNRPVDLSAPHFVKNGGKGRYPAQIVFSEGLAVGYRPAEVMVYYDSTKQYDWVFVHDVLELVVSVNDKKRRRVLATPQEFFIQDVAGSFSGSTKRTGSKARKISNQKKRARSPHNNSDSDAQDLQKLLKIPSNVQNPEVDRILENLILQLRQCKDQGHVNLDLLGPATRKELENVFFNSSHTKTNSQQSLRRRKKSSTFVAKPVKYKQTLTTFKESFAISQTESSDEDIDSEEHSLLITHLLPGTRMATYVLQKNQYDEAIRHGTSIQEQRNVHERQFAMESMRAQTEEVHQTVDLEEQRRLMDELDLNNMCTPDYPSPSLEDFDF